MFQEKKSLADYSVSNNSPDELIEIKLPDNWWQSQNTYFPKKTKSLKLIDLRQRREKEHFINSFPDWDIKGGDFLTNNQPSKFPLSRELRRKIKIIAFIVILLLAGVLTWLAAFLVSKI